MGKIERYLGYSGPGYSEPDYQPVVIPIAEPVRLSIALSDESIAQHGPITQEWAEPFTMNHVPFPGDLISMGDSKLMMRVLARHWNPKPTGDPKVHCVLICRWALT